MGKGALRAELSDSLSLQEGVALAKLLTKMRGSRPRTLLEHFNTMGTNTLFGFLHKELFGDWADGNKAFTKVMENLNQLKDFLQKIPPCPQIPYKMQINNKMIGEIPIAIHAWERFCERFYPLEFSSDVVADALKKSFTRAIQVRLGKVHEITRLISNNGQEAEYFFDQVLDCRFVIILKEGGKILSTVEIPRNNETPL